MRLSRMQWSVDAVVKAKAENPDPMAAIRKAAGGDKTCMVRALIEEYSRRGMLEEEKSDIQNAAAISFLGIFFTILRRAKHLFFCTCSRC